MVNVMRTSSQRAAKYGKKITPLVLASQNANFLPSAIEQASVSTAVKQIISRTVPVHMQVYYINFAMKLLRAKRTHYGATLCDEVTFLHAHNVARGLDITLLDKIVAMYAPVCATAPPPPPPVGNWGPLPPLPADVNLYITCGASGMDVWINGNPGAISHDNGATWTEAVDSVPENNVCFISKTGTRIFNFTDHLCRMSVDGGQSWTTQSTIIDAFGAVASDGFDTRIYAMRGSFDLYVSTDLGVTWTPLHTFADAVGGITVAGLSNYVYVTLGNAGIGVSSDLGVTWNIVAPPPGAGMCTGYPAAADGGQYAIAYTTSARIIRTADFGVSWNYTSLTLPGPPGMADMHNVAIDASGQHGLVIARVGAVRYSSSDFCANWAAETTPIFEDGASVCMNTGASWRYAMISTHAGFRSPPLGGGPPPP